ncbi:hypothetical protein ABPG74_014230 [Tetrahymena malaccensis]
MDTNNLDDLDVKNMIEGSICVGQYDTNICEGQYDTNFLSTRADTNAYGFSTQELQDNKDQKGQDMYYFEEFLVGENNEYEHEEEIPCDNNFNEQKSQNIILSKNTKRNYSHTYQNLGTHYYNFIKKTLSLIEMQGVGILKFEYEIILEHAQKFGSFKSKTELINIHKYINQGTKIEDDINYVDLITQKLQKIYQDLNKRIEKYNNFVRINRILFQQFKEETKTCLKNLENEFLETENQKTQKKLQIYEQIKVGIDKIEEKINNA